MHYTYFENLLSCRYSRLPVEYVPRGCGFFSVGGYGAIQFNKIILIFVCVIEIPKKPARKAHYISFTARAEHMYFGVCTEV